MGDSSQSDDAKNEQQIEVWKIKKLIKSLEAARGNGTSMISLILPPKDQISRAAKMLADEFGTASNIKSRVNRLSVLGAITSTQQRLKLYNRVPTNGLVRDLARVACGGAAVRERTEYLALFVSFLVFPRTSVVVFAAFRCDAVQMGVGAESSQR